jgi:hypothetical protein
MSLPICFFCEQNLIYKAYAGDLYLDDDGNKPCFDCLQEMMERDLDAREALANPEDEEL